MRSFQIYNLMDFDAFMVRSGFVSEPTNGDYEVARYRMPDSINNPVLVYRKKSGEMTVWPNGNEVGYLVDLVTHAFDPKSPKVTKVEAGEMVVSPASADDVPW